MKRSILIPTALAALLACVFLILSSPGCELGTSGRPVGAPQDVSADPEPPRPSLPRAAVEGQVKPAKMSTEDGEVVVGTTPKGGFPCARAGCARAGLADRSLVHAGKTHHFCGAECLAEYRKANKVP